jgi:MFS family permease
MFAVGTIFSPFVIRKHGFKKVMFCSSLGYAVFEGAGLVVALWEEMPKSLGWTFVLFGAALCGISASMIWVASAAYISEVAG